MDEALRIEVQLQIDNQISAETAKLQKEMKELEARFKSAEGTVKNFSNNSVEFLKKYENQLNKINKVAGVTLAGIGAGATLAIKKYADFEKEIMKVQTVSSASFEEIKKTAEDLSLKYGVAVESITDANYNLVSSMGDIEGKSLIMEKTLQLAKAGFADYGGTLSLTTKIMNAYSMKAEEVDKVTDILIQTQNKGVTTIRELEAQMGRVIPTAANYRVAFEDIAASYATLTSKAFSTEQATTTMDRLLNELGDSGTGVAKKLYEISGKSFPDLMKSGMSLKEVLILIGDSAKESGQLIDSAFSSSESKKAASTLYNNLSLLEEKTDAIKNSNGALKESYDTVSKSANQQFSELKSQIDDITRKFGEALIPKVKEIADKLQNVKWEEVFSQENVDRTISIAKGVAGVAVAITTLNGVTKAYLNTVTLLGANKAFWAFMALKGVTAAGVASVAAPVALAAGGAYHLNQMDGANNADLDKLKNENNALDKKREILSAIKDDLKNGIYNPELLKVVDGYSELSKILEGLDTEKNGEIEKGISAINRELVKTVSLLPSGAVDVNSFSEGTTAKDWFGTTETEVEKGISTIQKRINEMYGNLPSIWSALRLDDTSIIKEKIGIVESQIRQAIENGENTRDPSGFNKLVGNRDGLVSSLNIEEQKQKLTEQLERDKKQIKDFVESLPDELGKVIAISDLFGWDEDSELQAEVDLYTKQLSEMIGKGWDKHKPELFAEIKGKLDIVHGKQDEKYENKEQNKLAEENLKKEIETQTQAYKDTLRHLNSLGDSLYKVGDALENDFIKSLSAVVNSMSGMIESLTGQDGKGGLLGQLGNLSSGAGSFSMSSLGTLEGAGSALGAAGAAVGVFTAVTSMFNKDKSAEVEAKNRENIRKFEENTNAIRELTDKIRANTETLKGLSNQLIANIAKNPTLNRLVSGETVLGKMQKAIEGNRNFSDLTAMEQTRVQTGRTWYGRKKYGDAFTEIGINDKTLLEAAGISGTSIEGLSFEELKKFSQSMNTWDTDYLKNLTGKNLTESNIGELKTQISEYVKQIENLEREQVEFFRAATLESFKGVEYLDTKNLKEQYIKMYEDMGIDVSEYEDLINELVEANATLITSMQGVREEIIAGNKSFTEAMSGYFSDIVYNASSILYDTMFNELDTYFTDAFKSISEKLVEMKKEGKKLSPGELFSDMDWNKLLEGDKLQQEMKEQIDEIKDYLIEMGMSANMIESIFGVDGDISKIRDYLSNAINAALESGNFNDFSKSLGQSLYENVKQSLVKAFTETSLYKGLIEKFMITEDFLGDLNSATSFESAFDIIQKQLDVYTKLLEGNGLGFDQIGSSDSTTQNGLSGSGYYTDSPNEIKIEIVQNFEGNFFGEDTMRENAKLGAIEAIKEMNEKGQILTAF